jgi:hypothetical protein
MADGGDERVNPLLGQRQASSPLAGASGTGLQLLVTHLDLSFPGSAAPHGPQPQLPALATDEVRGNPSALLESGSGCCYRILY